jgi:AAA domain
MTLHTPPCTSLPETSFETPTFQPASMIANRAVAWLIQDLIAQGDITMVAGPKKAGKSLIAAHFIAAVTSGVPFAPGIFVEDTARGKAMLYTGERRTASFARPRLEAAGADLDLVGINDRARNIEEVIADIEKLPEGIRLIVIDPWKAYVNAANTSDEMARQIMRGLERIADKRNAAIVIVHHITLRRGRYDDATEYIQGKQVWVEAALCAHMLCRLQGGFIFENVASNKQAGQRFEYNIVSQKLADGTPTERIDMLGESRHSICDALRGQARLMVVKTRLERAVGWLREFLKDGPKLRNDVYAEAEKAEHAQATLIRAKKDGGIEDRKRRIDGLSEWFLPVGPDTHDSSFLGDPVEQSDPGVWIGVQFLTTEIKGHQ